MCDSLHNPQLPPARPIPAPSIASPSDLRPRDAREIRWYKPTWSETAKMLGWRWIYFLPAVVVIVLSILLPFLILVWWKLIIIAVVLPTGHAINVAAHILRSRKEPFCIHCGYDLSGLPDQHACPECGEPYTLKLIEEYKRDPNWFIKRYQMHHELPVRDVPFEARRSVRKSKDGT